MIDPSQPLRIVFREAKWRGLALGDDRRGQVIQVGAVLLLAIFIVSFATYQAFIVPDQNRNVEFEHNQRVQQQLEDLRTSMLAIGNGAGSRSVQLSLGLRYPSRVAAINPGPPSGSIRTVGTRNASVNVSVDNATAAGETNDFWNGTGHTYATGALVFTPRYNEYRNAPETGYENTLLYNQFRDKNITLTDQQLVTDDRITLVMVNGSLSKTQTTTTTVDLEALSSATRTVEIRNASAGNVTVTIPTRLSRPTWEAALTGERTTNGGRVTNLTTTPIPGTAFKQLRIELEPGAYTLRLAKVGVGSKTTVPDAAYLTTVSGDGVRVPESGTTRLVLEARDKFNNPISGTTVNVSTNRGTVRPDTTTTNSDGRVELVYEAPLTVSGSGTQASIDASLTVDPGATSSFDGGTAKNVTFDVNIQQTGTGSPLPFTVTWQDPSNETGVNCGPDRCTLDGDQTATVPLTVETNQSATGVDVEYVTNDSTVAKLAPSNGTTGSAGENETTLFAQSDGTVRLYATTGGDNDVIDFEITNFQQTPVFSAIEPDPSTSFDDDEFVRVYFPRERNTSGWTIADNDQYDMPDQPLEGEYYFTKDKATFTSNHGGINASRVFETNLALANGGEALELRNEFGSVQDEIAYGSEQTSNGWNLTLNSDVVGNRTTDANGSYVDTNSAGDWTTETEGDFFSGGGGGGSGNITYDGDATAGDFAGSNQNKNARIDLNVTNGHSFGVTITALNVSTTKGSFSSVYDSFSNDGPLSNPAELWIDTNGDGVRDGHKDTRVSADTKESLTTNADLPSGSTARIQFIEFVNSGDNPIDMQGEDVTVTVYYEDAGGTTYQSTFTENSIG